MTHVDLPRRPSPISRGPPCGGVCCALRGAFGFSSSRWACFFFPKVLGVSFRWHPAPSAASRGGFGTQRQGVEGDAPGARAGGMGLRSRTVIRIFLGRRRARQAQTTPRHLEPKAHPTQPRGRGGFSWPCSRGFFRPPFFGARRKGEGGPGRFPRGGEEKEAAARDEGRAGGARGDLTRGQRWAWGTHTHRHTRTHARTHAGFPATSNNAPS